MTTTFWDFCEGVSKVVIDGVKQNFGTEPPASVSDAGLPAEFMRVPRSTRSRFVYNVEGASAQGFGTLQVEVVILMEPVSTGLPEPNFDKTAKMSDAVAIAMTQADVAMSWPVVSTRVAIYPVAGHNYWALLATIQATG